MRWKSRTRLTPIGLDMGTRCLRAVQLCREAGGGRIVAAAELPLEGERVGADRLPGDLARTLKHHGFVGRSVVAAVAAERLLSGVLELPPAGTDAPREQIARTELAAMHKQDPASMELTCWAMPASGRNAEATRAMAVACPHDAADETLDAIEAAGLMPVALDAEPAALARMALRDEESGHAVSALLQLGQTACLLVVAADQTVIYERRLTDFGLTTLRSRLAESLGLEESLVPPLLYGVGLSEGPPAQPLDPVVLGDIRAAIADHYRELIREATISVSYARHQCPESERTRVLLSGAGARIPGLDRQMAQWINAETRIVTPGGRFESPASLSKAAGDPAMTLAAGLALWEAEVGHG